MTNEQRQRRIEELQAILEQHGTMTGDTTERDYEDLSEELEMLEAETE